VNRKISWIASLALTLAAASAFPQAAARPPQDREAALAALRSEDAARRAEGVVWIANLGHKADDALLHERLRDESPFVRAYAEQGLWLLWGRSGDEAIDRLMAEGVQAMQAGELAASIGKFSEVVRKRPDFAEGWNKRATAYYLAGEYRKSIADCDEVLKRNPRHFGALAGLGQIHFQLEQLERSLEWFTKALEVNPNMTGVEINIGGIRELLKSRRGRST
jgi:tetratricopeptide (TPR) repeat protein